MNKQLTISEKQPLHLQVAERIIEMIRSGGWRQGDQLPSYRELTKRLDVSYVTVKRAMDHLIDEEVITGRAGKGMFVHAAPRNKARQLKQIGLIVYCSHHLFFNSDYLMQMFQGVMLEAESIDCNVNIFSITKEGPMSPEELSSNHMDGIVMLSVTNQDYLESFSQHEIPVVVADSVNENVALDFVACDNRQLASLTVQQLVDNGHERIAYFGGFTTDTLITDKEGVHKLVASSDSYERKLGFDMAMTEHGLDQQAEYFPVKGHNDKALNKAVDEFMALKERPSAIVAFNAGMAASLVEAFEQRGVHVPNELSIVGVADSSNVRCGDIAIAYAQVPFQDMGRAAVKALAKRCKTLRPEKAKIQRIKGSWVSGNSVKKNQ